MTINIEKLDAYRRGAESGTMKSATPNVVLELLGIIHELRMVVANAADDLVGVQNCCHGVRGASGAKREARSVEAMLRKAIDATH